MKKKMLSLALIICISLAGCGNTVSQEPNGKISTSVPDSYNTED